MYILIYISYTYIASSHSGGAWRKQFHIGQANSSNMDIHVWKAGLPTGFRENDVQVLLCIAQSACKAC